MADKPFDWTGYRIPLDSPPPVPGGTDDGQRRATNPALPSPGRASARGQLLGLLVTGALLLVAAAAGVFVMWPRPPRPPWSSGHVYVFSVSNADDTRLFGTSRTYALCDRQVVIRISPSPAGGQTWLVCDGIPESLMADVRKWAESAGDRLPRAARASELGGFRRTLKTGEPEPTDPAGFLTSNHEFGKFLTDLERACAPSTRLPRWVEEDSRLRQVLGST